MSLHTDTKKLVDRVIRHATQIANSPLPAAESDRTDQQAGFTTDFLLVENEIMAFRADCMSPEEMTTFKDDLEKMVRKYNVS